MTEKKATPAKASSKVQSSSPDQADWREHTLARMRALILEAAPGIIEERKWRKASNQMEGVPVWSHQGIVCTGETYSRVVKLTFAKGASIPDPSHLFNSSLEGNTRRAIDIHEGETIDAKAFQALVKAAVALNNVPAKKAKAAPAAETAPAPAAPAADAAAAAGAAASAASTAADAATSAASAASSAAAK